MPNLKTDSNFFPVMKLLPRLACACLLMATTTGLVAATAPPPAPSPAPSAPAAPPESLPEALPASNLKLDDFINDLAGPLKLTDDEKKAIASFYQADDAQLKTILNSDTISPLEQDRQVTDLRAARNAKVETLLGAGDRMAAFLKIEAKYRVALMELATEGGNITPAPAAAPAPAPAAPAAPVSAKAPPPE